MVSSLRVDALNDPSRALTDFLASQGPSNLDTLPAKVAQHFAEIFALDEAFQEIPSLDVHRPASLYADNSLVRFRGMVQDPSASSEIYLARENSGKYGGWGLPAGSTSSPVSGDYANLRECGVVWAVSIPGESAWSREAFVTSRNTKAAQQHKSLLPRRNHKFPIPNGQHVGIQLKIYETNLSQSLKSTDVHSFVGILTTESLHAQMDIEPIVEVPTLHVLFSRSDTLMIVPPAFPYSLPEGGQLASINDLRKDLITWIADEGLAGDRDAAEWVLLSIISKVQSRTLPQILPPSLNISRFPAPPAGSGDNLPEPILPVLLSHILPTVTSLPLSLSTINTTNFYPESKDEDLHSGWLQLPSGSTLCMWEGALSEGTVSEKGIMNLRAVQDLMNGQVLDYVFPYSRFPFPTDIACIILSEGKKSAFFQTSVNVPLKPLMNEAVAVRKLYQSPDDLKAPHPDRLEMFRNLVGGAKIGRVVINDRVAEYIQEDFVKERQAGDGDKTMTSDDLIHRIATARLLALSYHSHEVTIDLWERTKALEVARKARLENFVQ